jgi:hypothetical protein
VSWGAAKRCTPFWFLVSVFSVPSVSSVLFLTSFEHRDAATPRDFDGAEPAWGER